MPEWAKLLEDNDPGKFTGAAQEPLLIIQGGNDEQIPVGVDGAPVRSAVQDRSGRRSGGSTRARATRA